MMGGDIYSRADSVFMVIDLYVLTLLRGGCAGQG
jgi:hypothetical protein